MEEIIELFNSNEDTVHQDSIMNNDEPKEYYIGKAEFILKQLTNKDNYFEFLKTIFKKYYTLSETQKLEIIDFLNIPEKIKIVEKEKIIYREKKTKPNICKYHDY